MNLSSSDLRDDVQKLVRKTLYKIVSHGKTDNVSANYVVEINNNVNQITNDCTRFEILCCSLVSKFVIFMTSKYFYISS